MPEGGKSELQTTLLIKETRDGFSAATFFEKGPLDEVGRANTFVMMGWAWEKHLFNKNKLHHACYYAVREQFDLSAQMVIRALGKVADSYKLDRKTKRNFKKHGAFPYDPHILSYRLETQTVSIWTLNGRETIPFQAGQRQLDLLQSQQSESDLAFIRGEFYLLATCEIAQPLADTVRDYMGVDLGITAS